MFKNFLFIAVRNFVKQPIYGAINVLGLVLGLTCCIFVLLWILDEMRIYRYHPDNNRVFTIMKTVPFSDGSLVTDHYTPNVLATEIKAQFPEVESVTRFAGCEERLFKANQKSNYEKGDFVDKSFFETLNIPLLEGNPADPLPDNNSIAISTSMAERFFKNEPALGKILKVENTGDFTVTAVYRVTDRMTFKDGFMLPFEIYVKEEKLNNDFAVVDGWLETDVKLRSESDRDLFVRKLNRYYHNALRTEKTQLSLLAMTDWRLYSNFENGKQTGGRINYVIAFSAMALFTLLIACVNFMNLSTANAANRSREVGIRKVAGASRAVLIRQFITESVALSFLSLAIALLVVQLLLPVFNTMMSKHLVMDYSDPVITGSLVVVALLTGVLAGSYPAFFLSSFRPASVLKGNLQSVFGGAVFRKILVVFQFALSVVIIISALVINGQLGYLLHKDVGYDRKNVAFILANAGVVGHFEAIRSALLQNPLIKSVSLAGAHPQEINGMSYYTWQGKSGEDNLYFNESQGDHDYIETFGFKMVQGRDFSRAIASDTGACIITESAADRMGFVNPIGQSLYYGRNERKIIGVIRDFQNLELQERSQPTVLRLGKNNQDYGRWAALFIRYSPGQTQEAVAFMKEVCKKLNPDYPIQYGFEDQYFENQFWNEEVLSRLSGSFTVIAIIISCLGLLGLTLFTTERRKKEIGIRKVLGATISGLTTLLCKDFVRLVLVALALGCPIAWFIMSSFLERYPYHENLGISVFLITALITLAISVSIIAWQSVKTALTNPVDVLKSE